MYSLIIQQLFFPIYLKYKLKVFKIKVNKIIIGLKETAVQWEADCVRKLIICCKYDGDECFHHLWQKDGFRGFTVYCCFIPHSKALSSDTLDKTQKWQAYDKNNRLYIYTHTHTSLSTVSLVSYDYKSISFIE